MKLLHPNSTNSEKFSFSVFTLIFRTLKKVRSRFEKKRFNLVFLLFTESALMASSGFENVTKPMPRDLMRPKVPCPPSCGTLQLLTFPNFEKNDAS